MSVPLHGYGNKNGQGEGVPIMTYRKPADPHQPWTTNTLAKSWHMTHNFEVDGSDLWIGAKEGIFHIIPSVSDARIVQIATNEADLPITATG